jgi:toxin ParE1/3/4
MYQLVIKPLVIEMVEDAYQWYEQEQPGTGEAFLNELEICYGKLKLSPDAYSKINRTYRQIRVSRFPYVIAFQIIKNEVIVYSVFHTSRNPKEKFKKE